MPQNPKKLPSVSDFLRWAVEKWYKKIGIAAGIFYVLVGWHPKPEPGAIEEIWTSLRHQFPELKYESLPSLWQFIVLIPLPVACAVTRLPTWLQDRQDDEHYKPAIKSCEQLKQALVWLISMWCLFYFLVFFDMCKGLAPSDTGPWIDLINNLQGVFLFACYWILTEKTTPGDKGEADRTGWDGPVPLWAVYLYFLWGVLLFLLADLYFSIASPIPTTREHFQLFSGLWVGVSLALVVGCLEGQHLGQPRLIALLLYFYAVLQAAYVGFFDANSNYHFLEVSATISSLPLKLIFIGYWIWVLKNGLLAFYMRRTREDIDEVRGEWGRFSGPKKPPSK